MVHLRLAGDVCRPAMLVARTARDKADADAARADEAVTAGTTRLGRAQGELRAVEARAKEPVGVATREQAEAVMATFADLERAQAVLARAASDLEAVRAKSDAAHAEAERLAEAVDCQVFLAGEADAGLVTDRIIIPTMPYVIPASVVRIGVQHDPTGARPNTWHRCAECPEGR